MYLNISDSASFILGIHSFTALNCPIQLPFDQQVHFEDMYPLCMCMKDKLSCCWLCKNESNDGRKKGKKKTEILKF